MLLQVMCTLMYHKTVEHADDQCEFIVLKLKVVEPLTKASVCGIKCNRKRAYKSEHKHTQSWLSDANLSLWVNT